MTKEFFILLNFSSFKLKFEHSHVSPHLFSTGLSPGCYSPTGQLLGVLSSCCLTRETAFSWEVLEATGRWCIFKMYLVINQKASEVVWVEQFWLNKSRCGLYILASWVLFCASPPQAPRERQGTNYGPVCTGQIVY